MEPARNVEAGPHTSMIQASLDHVEISWLGTVSQEPEHFTCQAIAYFDDADAAFQHHGELCVRVV